MATRVTLHAWSLRSRHGSRHGQPSVIADVREKNAAASMSWTKSIIHTIDSIEVKKYTPTLLGTLLGSETDYYVEGKQFKNEKEAIDYAISLAKTKRKP